LVVLVVLGAAMLAPSPAAARRKSRPASCEEARLLAVASYTQRAFRCHVVAAARGRRVAPRCLALAQARALASVQRFDRSGACLLDPRSADLIGLATSGVEETATVLRPTGGRAPCAARKLKVAGAAAGRLLTRRAQLTRVYDPAGLAEAVRAMAETVAAGFATAERRACPTVGDAGVVAAIVEQLAGLAGPLAGRIVLAKTIEFPTPAWPEVAANAALLQDAGFSVAMDGSSITGPPQPAGGWLVVLGSQRARTDANGVFRLDVPSGSPVEGQLYHPSNADMPMARFLLTELGTPSVPGQLDVELATKGRCGMNVNPAADSVQCGGARSAPHTAHDHGLAERAVLNPDPDLYPPKITGDLGTYPNPDPAAEQVACLDYDGYIQTGERGDSSLMGAISYPGSTCYVQVELGCCDNEAATIRRRIANLFDEERFPVLSCFPNHRGRYCQQITKGDIAARAKSVTARASERGDIYVTPTEKPTVDVHNNGCYGETHVTVRENAVGGVLVAPGFDGVTLPHDDGSAYFVDRQLQYWPPFECPADPEAVDIFDFEVDGAVTTLAFHCVQECPPPPGRFYSCTTTTTTTTLP